MTPPILLDAKARAVVLAAARENAHDLYLSALLAPRPFRTDLIVLAAFEGEIDRIPAMTSEPMRAEFRFQWWRDAVASIGGGVATGNPIADALGDIVARHGLSRVGLELSIDARSELLGAEAITSMEGLLQRADNIDRAAMLRFARLLTGRDASAGETEFLTAAGRAVTLARMAFEGVRGGRLARHVVSCLGAASVAERQMTETDAVSALRDEARRNFDAAKQLLSKQMSPARRSALPLALVEPYLHASERDDLSASRGEPRPILPLARVWRLWRLARLARL